MPTKFLDVVRMEQVTREIKRAVPKGQAFASSEKSPPTPSANLSSADSREAVATTAEEIFAESPIVESGDVAASLANSAAFGKQLAAHAWSFGLAAALLKFFIAEGSSTNWGIRQRHFKHLELVSILDLIHMFSYVYY